MATQQSEPIAHGEYEDEQLQDWPKHLRGARNGPNPNPKPKKRRKYRQRGHTFGAASECISLPPEVREEWARLNPGKLRATHKRSRRPKLVEGHQFCAGGDGARTRSNLCGGRERVHGLQLAPAHERDKWIELVEGKPYVLDLGMCWNTPNSLRQAERGWDDLWLQLTLTTYFAELDRRVFGGASCRRHTNRIVVLQKADGVGWHAHAQIMTPRHFSQVEFAKLAKEVWLGLLHGHTKGPFGRPLFWCEPVLTGHLSYILSNLSTNKVDEQNTHLT